MAEVQRALATLLANLPDNTSGLISPQDVRDAVVSLAGGFGGMEGQGTRTSVGTTKVLIDWWDTLLPDDVDDAVIGNLGSDQIDVTVAGLYHVHFSGLFSGTASKFFEIQIFVNGVAVAYARKQVNTDAGGLSGHASIDVPVSVGAGQPIDARVSEASTAGNTFAGDPRCHFWAKRLD